MSTVDLILLGWIIFLVMRQQALRYRVKALEEALRAISRN